MLHPFGQDIWLADGPALVATLGFHYPTRMAVIRLAGNQLLLWSPIAYSDALRQEVETLGEITHLVAPNALHHVHIGDWKKACPDARIWAAPGLDRKRPDLDIAGQLTETPPPDWGDQIALALYRGNAITTEAVLFHRPSGTALFTDLLQQMPRDWFTGWRRVIARLDLMTQDEPTVPRKFRLGFTNRKAARAARDIVRSWPVSAVVMAHGKPVTQDAKAYLDRAFAWLD
ncbi:DUF4336 domain-containing protein [Tropicibacter oceani]|uniref:DUF4336 domain-containing protein n=1 Tax=Tropicibacter oceani TaxID=3058420 RepID=A0ABY8QFN6_9RHOB|nr:DUF4336 domain-containing protein [Tropicibacter oceani]WGW03424.1 DUF4336 domain-containing protein [Tropicibacter oceani]